MKIIKFERDKVFECQFRNHHFLLERDPYSCNWYMIVKTEAGEYACQGWIDDSSNYTAKAAMDHACECAMVQLPKNWPKEVK